MNTRKAHSGAWMDIEHPRAFILPNALAMKDEMEFPMTPGTIEAIERLHAEGDDAFLRLARELRSICEAEPGAVRAICDKTQLKMRRVYALLRIARVFDAIMQDDARLVRIGWTKLDVIAPHVNKENYENLLYLAETNAPATLPLLLAGANLEDKRHTIQLTFSKSEYALFCKTIVSAGAKARGKGHVGKEKAIINIFKNFK